MAAKSAYHLLARPAGAACNLGCAYCFFLSKENLDPARESPLMPDEVLEAYIKQVMESSFGPRVEVAWQECRERPVLFACYGECPRNRFIRTSSGEEGLNYLCEGYKAFFHHIDKPMRTMAHLMRRGRYADEIMEAQQA